MTAARGHEDGGESGSFTNIQCVSFQCLRLLTSALGPNPAYICSFLDHIHSPHMGQLSGVLLH